MAIKWWLCSCVIVVVHARHSTILSFWTLRWLKGQNVRKMHIKMHKWTRLLTGPWSHGTWIQWDQARYSLHSSSTCTWHKPGMSQSVAQNTSYIRHHSYISHTLRLLWFKRTSFSSLFRFGQDPQKKSSGDNWKLSQAKNRSSCPTKDITDSYFFSFTPEHKNWRISLVQSFTAHKPLLMATSAFVFERYRWSSPQQCYLHCIYNCHCTVLMLS